eukprot:Em0015g1128a
MVQERFPHLRKRLEEGLDCLDPTEREKLHRLARLRADELQQRAEEPPLHGKVSLITGGNLVHVAADAIVNASNQWLSTGKGVNGAIHAAAGPGLLNECLALGGCGVGQAKITSGHNLPARYVIHTVGPEAREENRRELLRSCYKSCLELCLQRGIRTVAFSCISTGMYCYPPVEAADVALSTVREWLLTGKNAECIDRIIFVTRRSCNEEAYSTLMLSYFPVIKRQ